LKDPLFAIRFIGTAQKSTNVNKPKPKQAMKNTLTRTQTEVCGSVTIGNRKSMISGRIASSTAFGLVTMLLFLLLRPAVALADNPVTRPIKIVHGHLTLVVDPETGDYQFTDWGWATLIGKYTNEGSGVLDLATGQFLSGSGVTVAANGDTIDWIVGTVPNTVLDISGTGQFEGVSGGFAVTVISETLLSSNPDGTLTLAITYTGSGTLTY
jgi:hypothetical protein